MQMGVFATRSPYRPNPIGLSSARIERIELSPTEGPVIHVLGADLMDGTPIYDIKPYVTYADSHPNARSGFVDERLWQELTVEFPQHLQSPFSPESLRALIRVLSLDPRPSYVYFLSTHAPHTTMHLRKSTACPTKTTTSVSP